MSTTYQDPIGWPFLPVPQAGQLAYSTLEQNVRDSIRIILMTRPGEQLMRPRYGAGLENFLDEGNTIALRSQIQTAILQNLQNYENRITVDAVDVDPVAGSPAQLQIKIHYRLLRTNVSQQIGLTMQVG
ncbi:MAG: GPW/gp25 family protein [Terracidiphilus sp.]|jgi:phage baseplate assembly protein W